MRGVKRNLNHPQHAKLLAYLADFVGVTPQRFLEVVAARKAHKKAKFYRERSKRRRKGRKPVPRIGGSKSYAHEGEFTQLLRILKWSIPDFCEYAGVANRTAWGWLGHPMAKWPVELLRQRIQIARAEAAGVNMGQFTPAPLPKFPDGRYPRKRGSMIVEGKKLTEYSPWKN